MKILSIDTSCDETSVAVTDGRRVLSNVISSQIRYHKKFGGVVPFLAQRLHKERIEAVVDLAVQRSGLSWKDIEVVAVTRGPGLAPALEVGISKAKELSQQKQLPLYGVNHMAGHIASCLAVVGEKSAVELEYPALALLVSGGHTELIYIEQWGNFQIIGQTLDDALGEAYDKLAKMLGLGYPGGRVVSRLAKDGNPLAYPLPVPLQYSKDLNFSYSGLKNAVRLLIEDVRRENGDEPLNKNQIEDICAAFEFAAQKAVILKVEKAFKQFPEVRTMLLGGGVAANTALRRRLRGLGRQYGVSIKVPANLKLCTDNAAMIGVAAYLNICTGAQAVAVDELDRQPGLSL